VTKKADFNAEDWSTVVEGPVYAGLRVISAHKGGSVRESLAVGRVYQEARAQQGDSELLDAIVASPPGLDQARVKEAGGGADAIAKVVEERLRAAMAILEDKSTPEEIDAYKKFVMTVGQAAAEAHKEGGFLGIGGTKVSPDEEKALDEISLALGAPPES
jgi:hypothetical protein